MDTGKIQDTEHGGCEHEFDNHILIAVNGDPTLGGIILCPVRDCRCYSTFGFGENSERPMVALTQEELEGLHEAVWTGEMA